VLPDFQGLPYVRTTVDDTPTDSIQEAHRLNSPYLIEGLRAQFMARAEIKTKTKVAAGKKGAQAGEGTSDGEDSESSSGVDTRKLASAVFFYDPNSVLHGVFLEKVVGLARLTRVISGFIEASGVEVVQSGGVKNDRVDPSGKKYGGANKGFGNVPYSKAEYAAEVIEASFSFDSARVRAYGLPPEAQRLLLSLALWKIGTFISDGTRLRTACDLVVDGPGLTVRSPSVTTFPALSEVLADVKAQIVACGIAGHFAKPAVTNVVFPTKAEAK
jgi:CRISPR-associated protein Csb1